MHTRLCNTATGPRTGLPGTALGRFGLLGPSGPNRSTSKQPKVGARKELKVVLRTPRNTVEADGRAQRISYILVLNTLRSGSMSPQINPGTRATLGRVHQGPAGTHISPAPGFTRARENPRLNIPGPPGVLHPGPRVHPGSLSTPLGTASCTGLFFGYQAEIILEVLQEGMPAPDPSSPHQRRGPGKRQPPRGKLK